MNTPKHVLISGIALLSVGLSAAFASAPPLPRATPEAVGLSRERLQRIDVRIDEAIRTGRSAGAVVVIARHGRLAYEKAYGVADQASGQPMHTDQYFRLYSMTKPVTAAALLSLFEQGKFQLSDPLSKYLPAFAHVQVYAGENADGSPRYAAPSRPITIEDVFRHTEIGRAHV